MRNTVQDAYVYHYYDNLTVCTMSGFALGCYRLYLVWLFARIIAVTMGLAIDLKESLLTVSLHSVVRLFQSSMER